MVDYIIAKHTVNQFENPIYETYVCLEEELTTLHQSALKERGYDIEKFVDTAGEIYRVTKIKQ